MESIKELISNATLLTRCLCEDCIDGEYQSGSGWPEWIEDIDIANRVLVGIRLNGDVKAYYYGKLFKR